MLNIHTSYRNTSNTHTHTHSHSHTSMHMHKHKSANVDVHHELILPDMHYAGLFFLHTSLLELHALASSLGRGWPRGEPLSDLRVQLYLSHNKLHFAAQVHLMSSSMRPMTTLSLAFPAWASLYVVCVCVCVCVCIYIYNHF
jgi:hypothetical protein